MSHLEKQSKNLAKELSKKPADRYEENVSQNDIFVHVEEMKKRDLKEYYAEAGSAFYDVFYVAVTNKSDKNIIMSVPDTSVTTKTGVKKAIGNNLKPLMKKGNDGIIKSVFYKTGRMVMVAFTLGIGLSQGEPNHRQKLQEIYYQTTYDKALQSVVIPPYATAVGFLVLPDYPFHSYKSVNFKFQTTQKLNYFDIEYPMMLTTDKLRKQREKVKLEVAEQKRKEAEKRREEEIKLLKKKHKGL